MYGAIAVEDASHVEQVTAGAAGGGGGGGVIFQVARLVGIEHWSLAAR